MIRKKVGASLLSAQKVGASQKGWSVGPFSQKVEASGVPHKKVGASLLCTQKVGASR